MTFTLRSCTRAATRRRAKSLRWDCCYCVQTSQLFNSLNYSHTDISTFKLDSLQSQTNAIHARQKVQWFFIGWRCERQWMLWRLLGFERQLIEKNRSIVIHFCRYVESMHSCQLLLLWIIGITMFHHNETPHIWEQNIMTKVNKENKLCRTELSLFWHFASFWHF